MNRYSFSSGEEMNNHLCHECRKIKCGCERRRKLEMLQKFASTSPIVFGGKRIDIQKYLKEAMQEDE